GGTPAEPAGPFEESSPAVDNTAHIPIRPPANSSVSIGGWQAPMTGGMREFQSPPLTPGKKYTYKIQAQWEQNGRPMSQTKEVEISAGANVEVAFPAGEEM